jgi:pimeloyl-ACP methyl ester carboxylesterase
MIRRLLPFADCRDTPLRWIAIAVAICAAIASATGAHAHAQPAPAATTAAPAIQMDHISVQVIGKGSPVILVPGLSSPRAVWDGVAPDLAKNHTVYLVQVNGFGGEDPRGNLKPGLLSGIVADLDTLIRDRKLKDAAVIGHSMGGLVGLMLAKAHPGDVARLMIVDSLPFVGAIFMPDPSVAALEPQAAAMRDKMAAGYGKPANEAGIQGTAAGLALKPASREKVAGWMRAADGRVSGLAMYEDLTTDLREDVAAIQTPITLVYPWSAGMPKERAEPFYKAQYAKAPHVSFVDIGDAAHFVMLDQPEAFKAAVLAFAGE